MLAAVRAALAPSDALLARIGTTLAATTTEYTAHVARNKKPGVIMQPFRPRAESLRLSGERVAIEARAKGDGRALEADLKALGSKNVRRSGTSVTASVPLAAMQRLAALKSLNVARPLWVVTHGGATTSQSDASMRADLARTTYGVNGAGVKVGILSDSFDTDAGSIDYADDVASGDLPAGVQILAEYPAAGSDEGRAMAQLVYDTAPAAPLAFATAYLGQADFANNIRRLRDEGAKVIVDDVMYLAEPMFQDGPIARAIDDVAASGVAYFSAAGNQGRHSYQSAFRTGVVRAVDSIPSTAGAPRFGGGTTHDFDPGPLVDDLQSFTLQPGQAIFLSFQWDQPFRSAGAAANSPGSASDVDVYVLNSSGTQVLGGSTDDNSVTTGSGDPIEVVYFTNDGTSAATYNLMIANWGEDAADPVGPDPTLMKYVDFGSAGDVEHATQSPAVYGHANAAGAAAVAAAPWYLTPAYGTPSPVLESFSSAGRAPILFDNNGVRLATPQSRQAPLITAPDGGNTTFFGFGLGDGDAYPNFFGTSAAAPAAGAVAALMLSGRPTLTPTQVFTALTSTAVDMDDPHTAGFDVGPDDGTGYGLIQADAALDSLFPSVSSVAVNNGAAQRSRITSVTVAFDRAVTLDPDAFELVRRGTGGGPVTVESSSSTNGVTWILTFSGALTDHGSLADGIYDLTIRAGAIHDATGQTMAANVAREFHRLFSDADGDGDSDNADLFQIRSTYNKFSPDPAYKWFFDSDGDGDVDNADVFQIRSRRTITFVGY